MNRQNMVNTLAVAALGLLMLSGNAVSQRNTIKERLVGTWLLDSSYVVRGDGNKTDLLGSRPSGMLIYTSDGHFALVNTRSDLPKIASNNRNQATPEENKAIVQGSIAYFGTYSVDEPKKVITVRINGGTYPNMIGTDEQRIVSSLTADELKFANPASSTGTTIELIWKRAK